MGSLGAGDIIAVPDGYLPQNCQPEFDGGVDCSSRGFADLGGPGTWYHEAVDYVLRNGLMGGYGNGLFRPDDVLTRAHFAQILYNKAGSTFPDVAAGAWCAPAVAWAAASWTPRALRHGRRRHRCL